MALPKPSDVSNAVNHAAAVEPETEPEPEPSPFEGIEDDYQDYMMAVEGYRAVRKLAASHLFEDSTGVSNADIAALVDRSPLARFAVALKDHKDEIKNDLKARREAGEIPKEASLPRFKEEFEPSWDVDVVITAENLEENGISADVWRDNDEQIMVPAELEFPTDDAGNLALWDEPDEKELSLREVLAVAEATDGIGEKTLAALKENLENHLA